MSTDSTQESGVGNSALKRSRSEEVDRISDLPESLLLHILSFLSVICVVRTSALSRRWQYVWNGVPCLDFYSKLVRNHEYIERSENFVNRVLLQHKATSIQKFRLGSGLQDFSDMESWIRWAIGRNVEELDLSFLWEDSDLNLSHHLPRTIFGCKTLAVLKLKNLDVSAAFPPSACIPCLKTLELDSLRFNDHEFESKLISCCVVLEDLSIRKDVYGYLNDIRIHAQQLRRLKIRIYQADEYDEECVVDINAPNLGDLEIEDDGLYSPILVNVGNLSRAKINLNCSGAFKSLLKCFSALGNVKSLHLSSSHLEQACILEPGLTVHNVNLTRLTIEAGSVWAQLLPYFFHCFPNLEVMRLAKDTSARKFASKLCTGLKLLPAGLLSRLRVFVVQEFRGTNDEVGMLKYILNNSQVLDLALLHTSCKGTAEMLQVAQKKVLNFRRASKQCIIKFF